MRHIIFKSILVIVSYNLIWQQVGWAVFDSLRPLAIGEQEYSRYIHWVAAGDIDVKFQEQVTRLISTDEEIRRNLDLSMDRQLYILVGGDQVQAHMIDDAVRATLTPYNIPLGDGYVLVLPAGFQTYNQIGLQEELVDVLRHYSRHFVVGRRIFSNIDWASLRDTAIILPDGDFLLSSLIDDWSLSIQAEEGYNGGIGNNLRTILNRQDIHYYKLMLDGLALQYALDYLRAIRSARMYFRDDFSEELDEIEAIYEQHGLGRGLRETVSSAVDNLCAPYEPSTFVPSWANADQFVGLCQTFFPNLSRIAKRSPRKTEDTEEVRTKVQERLQEALQLAPGTIGTLEYHVRLYTDFGATEPSKSAMAKEIELKIVTVKELDDEVWIKVEVLKSPEKGYYGLPQAQKGEVGWIRVTSDPHVDFRFLVTGRSSVIESSLREASSLRDVLSAI